MSQFTEYLKFLVAKAIAVLIVAGILIGGTAYLVVKEMNESKSPSDEPFSHIPCSVAIIRVAGDIATLPGNSESLTTIADEVASSIHLAEATDHIKGLLFVIDSSGGGPVAAEMITDAIHRSSKPTVALIREFGTSGAYMVATGANTIIASPMSYVGSIGVTGSYVETAGQVEKDGGKFVELSTGKYKDSGNPDKPLSDEERALMQRNLNLVNEEFIKIVSENRGIPIDDVKKLADGSEMPGEMALDNKLIDAIGDESTAMEWFKSKFKPGEKVVVCEQ